MKRYGLLGAALLLAGCGHAPLVPPLSLESASTHDLFEAVCRPGKNVKSVRGSVWLKAKSKEASGQFPADVEALGPERLKIVITNLIGATEAVLTVEGSHYKIEVPNHKERNEHGESSWGGIPLEWASELFLGRIPCPGGAVAKTAKMSKNPAQKLFVVETSEEFGRSAEKYVYHLRGLDESVWPDSLHWERQGIGGSPPVIVDFKFEDPEPATQSPRKWEAKSAQGEVKARWKKDRQVETLDKK